MCSPGERRRRGGDAGNEGDRLRAPYLGHWPFCRGAQLQERDNVVRAGPLAKGNPRAKHPQAGSAGGKEVFLAFPFLKEPHAPRQIFAQSFYKGEKLPPVFSRSLVL